LLEIKDILQLDFVKDFANTVPVFLMFGKLENRPVLEGFRFEE